MSDSVHVRRVKAALRFIEASDPSFTPNLDSGYYARRNRWVVRAALSAAQAEMPVMWTGSEDGDTDWFVQYITLPTGQVSWHLPAGDCAQVGTYVEEKIYDGHNNATKYDRCHRFVEQVDR
jgi:hypothetical protein